MKVNYQSGSKKDKERSQKGTTDSVKGKWHLNRNSILYQKEEDAYLCYR